jgi:hypothetical protein
MEIKNLVSNIYFAYFNYKKYFIFIILQFSDLLIYSNLIPFFLKSILIY